MTDFNKTTTLVTTLIGLFTLFVAADANADNVRRQRYSAQQRAEIRAMPILERPSRPMHFYGNTVRRNAANKAKQTKTGKSVKGQSAMTNSVAGVQLDIGSQAMTKLETQDTRAHIKQASGSGSTDEVATEQSKETNFLLISLKKWLVPSDGVATND